MAASLQKVVETMTSCLDKLVDIWLLVYKK